MRVGSTEIGGVVEKFRVDVANENGQYLERERERIRKCCREIVELICSSSRIF